MNLACSADLGKSLRWLNVIDVVATVYVVCVLGVEEWNPIAAAVINVSVVLFVVMKIAAVNFFSRVLADNFVWSALAVFNVAYLGALGAHAVCLF